MRSQAAGGIGGALSVITPSSLPDDRLGGYDGSVEIIVDDDFTLQSAGKARHGLVLFLHPSVHPRRGWIDPLMRYMKRDDGFAVSPLLRGRDGAENRVAGMEMHRPLITPSNPLDAVLFSRPKLESILHEGADRLFASAWRRGWRSYVAPESIAFADGPSKVTPCPPELLPIFQSYYGNPPPAAFEAAVARQRRKVREPGPAFDREIEAEAAAKLKSAFADAAVLDLGCGRRKFEGAVGMDARASDGVDVVHDLDDAPWPFDEGAFDLVIASHVLEHVRDFGRVLSECFRVLRPEGTLIARCPHFSCRESYINPTHVRHLAVDSMRDMLCGGMPGERHDMSCGLVPFRLVRTVLTFRGRKRARIGRFLARRSLRRWEQYWSRILPAQELCWIVRKRTLADEQERGSAPH